IANDFAEKEQRRPEPVNKIDVLVGGGVQTTFQFETQDGNVKIAEHNPSPDRQQYLRPILFLKSTDRKSTTRSISLGESSRLGYILKEQRLLSFTKMTRLSIRQMTRI